MKETKKVSDLISDAVPYFIASTYSTRYNILHSNWSTLSKSRYVVLIHFREYVEIVRLMKIIQKKVTGRQASRQHDKGQTNELHIGTEIVLI